MQPSEYAVNTSNCRNINTIEFTNQVTPSNEYFAMVITLNNEQRTLHDFIIDWCWEVKNNESIPEELKN